MFSKSDSFSRFMGIGCCSCFGFNVQSQEHLLSDYESDDGGDYDCERTDMTNGSYAELQSPSKRSEQIILFRIQTGKICREIPVKETHLVVRSEDDSGNKMVNEYVREFKIGSGSYAKVVLYRSTIDGKRYAIKAFHKSHLLKQRVAPSETAMSDVLREVLIMKMLDHPNIVNLIEVMDDPNTDQFYMVLEYVEGKWAPEGSGASGGLEDTTVRKYLRDIVAGLMYLHTHNVVHGDIKPDNLLVTGSGVVKIADFSVSQVFEDENDELRRSPGTPVFTAPECCSGITYHGRAADTWALGVTLYYMVFGKYPFIGDTLQETYDKIVNNPITIPNEIDSQLKNLLEGILCKDPQYRFTLNTIAEHPWVLGEEGPIPQHVCRCKRNIF
ncbi:hypothetical protein MKW98_026727 [Papaver atlanticum]|uniref:non-specific serine/threonine protein kinase n=1 Tax=Papaver atlanticum TaxID=357466 RepID=A0AAD4X5E8_9MAGN|nr:hypothetical protein MKW98_026727 [Papaver atlanticum]